MDIIFTKVGNLVQLQYWSLPQPQNPSHLVRTELLTVEEARRSISNQRPDILDDFNTWVTNNFS